MVSGYARCSDKLAVSPLLNLYTPVTIRVRALGIGICLVAIGARRATRALDLSGVAFATPIAT
jgi:hypothetical protein